MRASDLRGGAWAGKTRRCAAPAEVGAARALLWRRGTTQGTPVGLAAGWSMSIETYLERQSWSPINGLGSRRAARCGWRGSLIREKIIGHRMRPVGPRFAAGKGSLDVRGTLALFHEPARQHRRGVLFQPLIEQGADFFPEIGGMAQARQFIRLQRVARSGQKELPGGLGVVAGHGILLRGQEFHSNTVVITFKDNQCVNGCGNLWKTCGAPCNQRKPPAESFVA